MAAALIFNIEQGIVAFSLVGAGDDPTWQAPGGKEADAVTAADYTGATGVVFSCQVQSGELTATPNTSDKVTDPTFCDPEVTVTQVGVTSYELAITALQDPHDVDGMSFFAFKNDTKLAYYVLGLNSWGAPKSIGKCRIVAGTFGGTAREDLTTDITCPVETKPDIQFGTDAGWVIVHGDGSADTSGTTIRATGATEVVGAAGTWTPASSIPPATVADLIAGVPNPIAPNPSTDWSTGSFVQTGTPGAPGQAHYDTGAWVAGVASFAADQSAQSGDLVDADA